MNKPNKIKLKVQAQSANSSPSLGPVLGQNKINIQQFTLQFNNSTKIYVEKLPLSVEIIVEGKSKFSLIIKLPSINFFLIEILKHQRFLKTKDKKIDIYGIPIEWIYEIALVRVKDKPHTEKEFKNICKSIIGTMKSLGISIIK
jgi:large subunit ribosomal protein L11